MKLWTHWLTAALALRSACSRMRSFLWFITCIAGMTVRIDLLGVTSILRALGLSHACYDRLLDFFHGTGLKLDKLARVWTRTVLTIFPSVPRVNGRLLLVGDGIKIPKEGKKMPSVKGLHQDSESNSKPSFIMGHSFQTVGILAHALTSVFAVPLISRIHEGLVVSNRDTKTLLDKMIILIDSLGLDQPFYFIADAYYASGKIVKKLLIKHNHLISRVKNNAVAYFPSTKQATGRGRKKVYGEKIHLRNLLENPDGMHTAPSPIYGEINIQLRYLAFDLIWRPVGILVRFVAVLHPVRGKCILMSTDLSLSGLDIIGLYGLRFKIELSFKQAVRT
ncbi:MAG TPA: transposase, partial [Methylomicrobium sp.]|nr:transposase [Methylomicrobium sp.]